MAFRPAHALAALLLEYADFRPARFTFDDRRDAGIGDKRCARDDLGAQRAYGEDRLMPEFALELLRAVLGGGLPQSVIEEKLLSRFFGQVKANVPWRVIKGLCKDDRLVREKNKGAAADPMEMISLPTPPDTEGGAVVPIRRVA
jgi:hypothetical protein